MRKLLLIFVLVLMAFSSCDKFDKMMGSQKNEYSPEQERNFQEQMTKGLILSLEDKLEKGERKSFKMGNKISGGYVAMDNSAYQKVLILGSLDHIDYGNDFSGNFISKGKQKVTFNMVNKMTGAKWDKEEYLNTYEYVDKDKIRDKISSYKKKLRKLSRQ